MLKQEEKKDEGQREMLKSLDWRLMPEPEIGPKATAFSAALSFCYTFLQHSKVTKSAQLLFDMAPLFGEEAIAIPASLGNWLRIVEFLVVYVSIFPLNFKWCAYGMQAVGDILVAKCCPQRKEGEAGVNALAEVNKPSFRDLVTATHGCQVCAVVFVAACSVFSAISLVLRLGHEVDDQSITVLAFENASYFVLPKVAVSGVQGFFMNFASLLINLYQLQAYRSSRGVHQGQETKNNSLGACLILGSTVLIGAGYCLMNIATTQELDVNLIVSFLLTLVGTAVNFLLNGYALLKWQSERDPSRGLACSSVLRSIVAGSGALVLFSSTLAAGLDVASIDITKIDSHQSAKEVAFIIGSVVVASAVLVGRTVLVAQSYPSMLKKIPKMPRCSFFPCLSREAKNNGSDPLLAVTNDS